MNLKLPPGLEPASMNSVPLAEVGVLLGIELDGGRVYLDDDGNLFALPEDAAVRDRLVEALNASGAVTDYVPLPLISVWPRPRSPTWAAAASSTLRSTPPPTGSSRPALTSPTQAAGRRGALPVRLRRCARFR